MTLNIQISVWRCPLNYNDIIIIIIHNVIIILVGSAVDLQCAELCLQDEAQYSCIINGTTLRWSVPNLDDLAGFPHVLDITTFQQQLSDPTNTFTAVLTDTSNNQLNSTLSFIATNQLNNKQIKCRAGSNSNTEKTCSIMILGK